MQRVLEIACGIFLGVVLLFISFVVIVVGMVWFGHELQRRESEAYMRANQEIREAEHKWEMRRNSVDR